MKIQYILLFCVLMFMPVTSADPVNITMTELSVNFVGYSNDIQLWAHFNISTNNTLPVHIKLYDPSNVCILTSDDIAIPMYSGQHLVYSTHTLDSIESGTYTSKYIFYLDNNTEFVTVGTFVLQEDNTDIVTPMVYESGDMKKRVYRFVAFSIVVIVIFLYIATRP